MVQNERQECNLSTTIQITRQQQKLARSTECSIEQPSSYSSSSRQANPIPANGSLSSKSDGQLMTSQQQDVIRKICPLVKHKQQTRGKPQPGQRVASSGAMLSTSSGQSSGLRAIDVVGQLNHSAIRGALLLAMGLVCLSSVSMVESSVWPFSVMRSSQQLAAPGLWPSMLAAMNRSSSSFSSKRKARHSDQLTPVNRLPLASGQESAAKQPSPVPPPISKQYHYFWNHDQVEPNIMAAEANKILAEAQAQTDRIAVTALGAASHQPQPRSSDASVTRASIDSKSPVDTLQASGSALAPSVIGASGGESFAVPPAIQQQLTAMVLQMQRQQQASMMMQPKFGQGMLAQGSAQRRFSSPTNPMSRMWAASSSGQPMVVANQNLSPMQLQMQMQMAAMSPMMAAESVQQAPTVLMPDPFQQMGQLIQSRASPAAVMAGVPIFGPFPVSPSTSMLTRLPFTMSPLNQMVSFKQNSPVVAGHQRPAASRATTSGRRKSWPFSSFTSSPSTGDRSVFAMSASQPLVSISPPPQSLQTSRGSRSSGTRSMFGSPMDPSAALMDLSVASTHLATAIASQLQGKLSEEKLLSSLVRAFEQASLPVVDQQSSASESSKARVDNSPVFGSKKMQAPYSMVTQPASSSSLINSEGFKSIAEPLDLQEATTNLTQTPIADYRLHRRETSDSKHAFDWDSHRAAQNEEQTRELRPIDQSDGMDDDELSGSRISRRSKRSSGWKSLDTETQLDRPNKLTFEPQREAKMMKSTSWSAVPVKPSALEQKTLTKRLSVDESSSAKPTLGPRASGLAPTQTSSSLRESKSLKVKRISFIQQDQPVTAAEPHDKASVISGAAISLPRPSVEAAADSDPMAASLSESTRISNYFQNVGKEEKSLDGSSKTTDPKSASQRPSVLPASAVGSSPPIAGPQINVGHSAPSKTISTSMSYSVHLKPEPEKSRQNGDDRHHLARQASGNGSGAQHPLVDYSGNSQLGSAQNRYQTAQQVSQGSQSSSAAGSADISSSATRHVPYSIKNSPLGQHSASNQQPPTGALVSGQQATAIGQIGASNPAPVASISRQQNSEPSASLANLQGKILSAFFNLRQEQQSQNNKQRSSIQPNNQPSSSLFNSATINSRLSSGAPNQATGDKSSEDHGTINQQESYDKSIEQNLGEPPMPPPPSSQHGSMSFFGSLDSEQSTTGNSGPSSSAYSSSSDPPINSDEQSSSSSNSLEGAIGSGSIVGDSSFGSRTPPSVDQSLASSSNNNNNNNNGGSLGDTINLEQAIELSRYNQQQQQPSAQVTANLTDSFTSDGPELYGGSSSSGQFGLGSLSMYQSDEQPQSLQQSMFQQPQMQSTRQHQQVQFYSPQQLQALGAIVSNLNQQRMQLQEATVRNHMAHRSRNNLHSSPSMGITPNMWTNSMNGELVAGSAPITGLSNYPNAAQLMAMQSQSVSNQMASGSEQRSEQADEEEGVKKKPKKEQKKKQPKQVSHHYHFNSFGPSALDDQEFGPLNPIDIMGSLSANDAAFLRHQKMQQQQQQQKAKANKDEDKQEDDDKPKKKGFLRRFSLKNLFKKLKKDKKPSEGEESGGSNGNDGESQSEK